MDMDAIKTKMMSLNHVNAEIEKLLGEYSQVLNQNQELSSENAQLKKQIFFQTDKLTFLETKTSEQEKDLKAELDKYKSLYNTASHQASMTNSHLVSKISESQSLLEKIATLEKCIHELAIEKKEISNQLTDLQKKHEEINIQIEVSNNEKQKASQFYKEKLADFETQMEELETALQEAHQKSDRITQQYAQEKERLKETNKILQNDLLHFERTQKEFLDEMNLVKTNYLEEKNRTQKEIDGLVLKIKELEAKLVHSQNEKENLHQILEEKIRHLELLLRTEVEQSQTLKHNNQDLNAKIQKINQEFEASGIQIQALTQSLRHFEEMTKQNEMQLNEALNEVKNLEREKMDLLSEMSLQSRQLQALKESETARQSEMDHLSSEFSEVQQINNDLLAEIQGYQNEKQSWLEKSNHLQVKLEGNAQRMHELNLLVDSLKEKNKELEKEKSNFSKDLSEQKNIFNKVYSEKQDLEKAFKKLETDSKNELNVKKEKIDQLLLVNQDLQFRASDLHRRLESSEATRQTLSQELRKFLEVNTELSGRYHQLAEEFTVYKTQTLEKMNGEKQEHEDKLRYLEQEKESLAKAFEKKILEEKTELDFAHQSEIAMVKNQARQEIECVQKELAEKNQEQERFELKQKTLEIENHQLRQQIESLLKSKEKRDLQVRTYVQHVQNERDQIRAKYLALSREINEKISLHPLNDFLIMTESQIESLEVDLRKSAVTNPHRPRMEKNMEQLIAQRNQIRGLIEATKNYFLQQAREVDREMITIEKQKLPPLPF